MSSRCRRPSQLRPALLASALLLAAAPEARCDDPHYPTPQPRGLGAATTTLFPGGGAPPPPDPRAKLYEGNPQAISEGKRLYQWYNCSGCHFNGAGGMGPALMDDEWRYGGRMDQIHATLVQGRPNGMPSWAGKIPDDEMWKISAFVKSLSAPNPANAPGQAMPTSPPPPSAPPPPVKSEATQ